jgi:hypothetical protein
MATATNGRMRTAADVLGWVESIDKPYVTTGDAMEKFGISRATARDRLSTLAEEGLLTRTGNGRGAKYHTGRTGDGDGGGKPVFAADVTELDFIRKLASDCDQELERIDGEIAALEAAREELLAQEAKLRAERESVARAQDGPRLDRQRQPLARWWPRVRRNHAREAGRVRAGPGRARRGGADGSSHRPRQRHRRDADRGSRTIAESPVLLSTTRAIASTTPNVHMRSPTA